MMQAEAQASLDRAQGNLDLFGYLRMGPALKIGEFDNLALFSRNFQQGGAYLRTLNQAPGGFPGVRAGCSFIQVQLLQRGLLNVVAPAAQFAQVIDGAMMQD